MKHFQGDDAVSAVLGALLMLALMMSMLPAMITLSNENKALAEARADETRAERERAELAAWCARNPDVGEPTCQDAYPMRGYSCHPAPPGGFLCLRATTEPPRA